MASQSCKPSKGALRKSCIPIRGPSTVKASTISRRSSIAINFNYKSTMNKANNNEIKDGELQSWYDWVGRRVLINGKKIGTLRFFGKIKAWEGYFCGVELDEPIGKNNGRINNVTYFTCEDLFGIFVPLSRIEKILTDSKDELNPEPKLSSSAYTNCMFSEVDASQQCVKGNLLYCNENINEGKRNSVNERPQKVHCKSDTFPEQRADFNMNQCSNYNESNNANNFSLSKISERRESTPAINPINKKQILNQTVVLHKGERKTNSVQNVTFDILDPKDENIINSDKRGSTFVIHSPNISHDDLPKVLLARSNTEGDTYTELEESSLGILSYSQMNDLTLCCNRDNGVKSKKAPEIRKMDSCDDVNEIPEFEESKIADDTICETLENSVFEQSETFEYKHPNSKSYGSDELNKTVLFNHKMISNVTDECHITNTNNIIKLSLDSSHLEDINLNIAPHASSTPISSTLDLTKFEIPKSLSTTSLDIHSPNIGYTVPSTTLNQTYDLLSKETNSSTPKLNVISKFLHNLDISSEESADVSHSDCLNSESALITNYMPNDISPEACDSNVNKSTSNVALNIDSTEKEPVLFQTFNTLKFKKYETDDTNSNPANHLEGRKKFVPISSCHTEESGDHTSTIESNFVSSHLNLSKVDEENITLNTKISSNDSTENATLKNVAKILSETYSLEQPNSQNTPSVMNITDIFCPSERNECIDFNLETIKEFSRQENNSDEALPSDTISAVDDSEADANLTFSRDSSVCSYQHSEVTAVKHTESVFSVPVAKQKQSNKTINIDAKGPVKQSKRNVVSKIKLMLEKNKKVVTNRENVNSKSKFQMSKNVVTPKIASTLTDNKSKAKTEVTSRINTNLKASRSTMPKPSTQSNKLSEAKKSEIPRGNLASKIIMSTQKVSRSKSISLEANVEKDSRVLSQLQNVDSFGGQINESKGLIKSRPKTGNTALLAGNKEKELPAKNAKGAPLKRNLNTQDSNRPAAPKFVSKTALVKQIQELGALCESRTKGINMMKIRLRHAHLGLEALIIINKYIVEQLDPFYHSTLLKRHEISESEKKAIEDKLKYCQEQLTKLENEYSDEMNKLSINIEEVHTHEVKQLKFKHNTELEEMGVRHEKQVKIMKENFKANAKENEEFCNQVLQKLQDDQKKQKIDLEAIQACRLGEITERHNKVKTDLENQIKNLSQENKMIQKHLKEMEESFMKDKNSQIQHHSAKKNELEKEVESLTAVIEMKNMQINDLNTEHAKMKEQISELSSAKENVRLLDSMTEELKSKVEEKVQLQRELSDRIEQLKTMNEKQARDNRRLSMCNEQLQWRLQQKLQAAFRPSSSCVLSASWHVEKSLNNEKPDIGVETMPLKRDNFLNTPSMNQQMSMSWAGETFSHYYENLDDSHLASLSEMDLELTSTSHQSVKSKLEYSELGNISGTRNLPIMSSYSPKNEVGHLNRKYLPCGISLYDSYASDSSSYASYPSTHPGTEESSSCSHRSKDSDLKDSSDPIINEDMDPLSVRHPRNLAGEAMIQDIESVVHLENKGLPQNKDEYSQIDESLSPEESKEKLTNQGSMTTPSIDTLSSQGMADSTNFDISWGDEEILSENES